jgi:hypothetical protein
MGLGLCDPREKLGLLPGPGLQEILSNKKFWEELIAFFPSYGTDRRETDGSNNSSIVACVFVAAITFYRAVA